MEDGRVIPLLLDLDLKEISGPLAQFQAKKADINGIKELIFDLNKTATPTVPEQQLEKLFIALWGELESQISVIPKANIPSKTSRPQGEILEELVSGIRSVEMRFRDIADDTVSLRKRRRSRYHPGLLMEMLHRVRGNSRDPIQLLMSASFFREEAPWVSEIINELYRSIKINKRQDIRTLLEKLHESIELIKKGPYADEIGIDPRLIDAFMFEVLYPLTEKHFGGEPANATTGMEIDLKF